MDELRAIVEGVDRDARGERLANLFDLGLDPLGDGTRVLAHQHHDDTDHRLAASVPRHRALANHGREFELGNIAHIDRRSALVVRQHDLTEVFEALDQPFATDDVLLAPVLDVAAANVAVVGAEGAGDIPDRESIGDEPVGVEGHLVGLELPAKGVDLDHARHRSELVVDDPVEQSP